MHATQSRLLGGFLILYHLHLGMVTIFSIGIWFPVTPTRYYYFRIVPQRPSSRSLAQTNVDITRHVLQLPLEDSSLITEESPLPKTEAHPDLQPPRLNAPNELFAELPAVELPKLEFTNLERIRLETQSLEIRKRHEEYWESERDSNWAALGRQIAKLRDALATWPFLEDAFPKNKATNPPNQFASRGIPSLCRVDV